jgi:hypothetical protein
MPEPRERNSGDSVESEDHLYAALRAQGFLIPVSEAEVEQVELEMARDDVEMPAVLQDPHFLEHAVERHAEAFKPNVDVVGGFDGAAENLARAAREGGTISPEVDAQMQRDRERAERQADGRP